MQFALIVLMSLVPGVFWVWYFRTKDKFEQEPWAKLAKVALFGAIAVIPAALFEMPFRQFLDGHGTIVTHFLVAFFVVGLGEEFFKFLAMFLGSFLDEEFNEPVDGVMYAISAAIGFSVVENVLYISSFGIEIAPLRAIIASLAHVSFSGILGFYLGLAKKATNPRPFILKGIAIAAFLHGLYDFILLSQIVSPLMVIVLVGVLFYTLLLLIDKAVDVSPFQ